MKKNKEWAFIELGKLFPSHAEMHDSPDYTTVTKCELLNKVYDILNQLDEPETLSIDKEQLIKRIENYIPLHDKTVGDVLDGILEIIKQLPELEVLSPDWIDENQHPYGGDYQVPSEKLENLLVPKLEIAEEQVTEYLQERNMTAVDSALVYRENLDNKIVIEKPTIPEFVAEFLDGKEKYMLYELLDDEFIYNNHDELARWLYNNDEKTNKERELNLVLAQKYDYEVKEEQLFYVVGKDNTAILSKGIDSNPYPREGVFSDYFVGHEDYMFTEHEIKDYDPRYWEFRKPVEEME